MKHILLTDEQLEILKPLFDEVRASNEQRITSAIAAQIYQDGMIVKVMIGDKADALAKALGGANLKEPYASFASERLGLDIES